MALSVAAVSPTDTVIPLTAISPPVAAPSNVEKVTPQQESSVVVSLGDGRQQTLIYNAEGQLKSVLFGPVPTRSQETQISTATAPQAATPSRTVGVTPPATTADKSTPFSSVFQTQIDANNQLDPSIKLNNVIHVLEIQQLMSGVGIGSLRSSGELGTPLLGDGRSLVNALAAGSAAGTLSIRDIESVLLAAPQPARNDLANLALVLQTDRAVTPTPNATTANNLAQNLAAQLAIQTLNNIGSNPSYGNSLAGLLLGSGNPNTRLIDETGALLGTSEPVAPIQGVAAGGPAA